jgi:hypothetical protein
LVGRTLRDQIALQDVEDEKSTLLLDGQRAGYLEACFEFSDKSAANGVVRKGCMGMYTAS